LPFLVASLLCFSFLTTFNHLRRPSSMQHHLGFLFQGTR
jgi:hypothetical protein